MGSHHAPHVRRHECFLLRLQPLLLLLDSCNVAASAAGELVGRHGGLSDNCQMVQMTTKNEG